MTIKEQSFKVLAENVIKKLEKRNMEGYYCDSSADCVSMIMDIRILIHGLNMPMVLLRIPIQ